MGVLRDRRVLVLLVLVLLGSGLSATLALTRPAAEGVGAPPGRTEGVPGFRPADLVGPGGDALAVATQALSDSLSYDHRDLDESLRRATVWMTRDFAATYTRTFDDRVRPVATQRAATAEGLVRGAGVVRTRGDTEVVCLLYVDQVLLEGRGVKVGAEPRVLTRNRARVDMELVEGVWLVAGIRSL